MDASISSVFFAIAASIVLAITSMRYGVDSREGFGAENRAPDGWHQLR